MRTAKTRVDIPICLFLYSFIVLVSLFVWFKFEALKDTPKKINLWFWKKVLVTQGSWGWVEAVAAALGAPVRAQSRCHLLHHGQHGAAP